MFIKKVIAILMCGCIFLSFAGCSTGGKKILSSIGKAEKECFYSHGGFQDYTDYAKYSYKSVDFENNEYFKQINDEAKAELEKHISDFENWVDVHSRTDENDELVKNYDFDESVISIDDYVYIYDDPDYSELGNYDVYFFDTETRILYYFHNNI